MEQIKFNISWPSYLVRALRLEGVSTWEQLAALSPATLLTHRQFGPKTLLFVKDQLSARGFSLDSSEYHRGIGVPGQTPEDSGVYFIRCGPFVKIGWSHDVATRAENIHKAMPYDATLVHFIPCEVAKAGALERKLHKIFSRHRHRNEWFFEEGKLKDLLSRLERNKKSRVVS